MSSRIPGARYANGLATDGKSFWVTWTQQLGNSTNAWVKRFDIATSA